MPFSGLLLNGVTYVYTRLPLMYASYHGKSSCPPVTAIVAMYLPSLNFVLVTNSLKSQSIASTNPPTPVTLTTTFFDDVCT